MKKKQWEFTWKDTPAFRLLILINNNNEQWIGHTYRFYEMKMSVVLLPIKYSPHILLVYTFDCKSQDGELIRYYKEFVIDRENGQTLKSGPDWKNQSIVFCAWGLDSFISIDDDIDDIHYINFYRKDDISSYFLCDTFLLQTSKFLRLICGGGKKLVLLSTIGNLLRKKYYNLS